jgi:hypothetical protein
MPEVFQQTLWIGRTDEKGQGKEVASRQGLGTGLERVRSLFLFSRSNALKLGHSKFESNLLRQSVSRRPDSLKTQVKLPPDRSFPTILRVAGNRLNHLAAESLPLKLNTSLPFAALECPVFRVQQRERTIRLSELPVDCVDSLKLLTYRRTLGRTKIRRNERRGHHRAPCCGFTKFLLRRLNLHQAHFGSFTNETKDTQVPRSSQRVSDSLRRGFQPPFRIR